ncbi:MAG TPA: hypothetical protein VM529_25845, partial [Gemmata sp.]|nr:hypothetical protein [Gemmata sp.]
KILFTRLVVPTVPRTFHPEHLDRKPAGVGPGVIRVQPVREPDFRLETYLFSAPLDPSAAEGRLIW